MGKKKLVAGVTALLALLVACGERQAANQRPDRPRSVEEHAGSAPALGEPQRGDATVGEIRDQGVAASTGGAKGTGGGSIGALPVPEVGAKVIKTANLEVRIKKDSFQENFSKASLIAERLGGFVTSSSISETKGKVASGVVTLRVPSDKFQTAISELRALGKVTREDQSGEDVSREFVDLEARLRHARAQETFYLRLMDQAKSISDLLQIQQQLSAVQLQIEELTGRLEFLKNQTAFSTVTVRIFEPGVGPGKPKGALGRAWQEALDGSKSVVAGLIVALGWVAPIGPIALILFGLWRGIRARATKAVAP